MALSPELLRTRAPVVPDRATVLRLFEQGDLVPVYRTLLADLETPVSVFLKLARPDRPSFLLESVEGGEQVGRYSFLGVDAQALITVQDDTLAVPTRRRTRSRARSLRRRRPAARDPGGDSRASAR
ncbi:MAG: hypothetical protein KatS3mg051_1350 [Anaerolineae bacterium]|nr:MAG: hypothetical protein KatS3mg051_1350 [Anaerolineae bacterium]